MAGPFEAALAHYQGGRLAQAELVLRRAVGAGGGGGGGGGSGGDPDGRAASLLAMVLCLQGRHDQAEHFFRRALGVRPDSPALRTNFGNMLLLTGRLAEARAEFEAALRTDDGFAAALIGLAPTLYQLGDLDGAIDAARRAVALAPLDASAHLNLGSALGGAGYVEQSLRVLRGGLEIEPRNIKLITNYLMSLHYPWPAAGGGVAGAQALAEALWTEHRVLGARMSEAARVGLPVGGPSPKPRGPRDRLRVAYLSSDLRNHVVATFLRPLLEHRDRERFHVTAYHTGALDGTSKQIEALADTWRWAAGMDDRALEKRIRDDRPDILIDLNGHTEGSRVALLARRLAPVQVTYLGYPDTTGLAEVDARIVDEVTDPCPVEGSAAGDRATERLVRLPRCFLCYRPPSAADAPEPGHPPSVARGCVRFGSFNAAPKVSDGLLALWARVLRAVPGSRLMLKNRALSSEKRRGEVLAVLRAHGVEPERVELVGWRATAGGHLASYAEVDVGLDAYPYCGTTTTCEALWMGVPVVTLAGVAHVSRVGASLLSAAGLPELIARDEDEYVRLASGLAGDAARLAALREGLRDRVRASSLCDGPGACRAFEAALRALWDDPTIGASAAAAKESTR